MADDNNQRPYRSNDPNNRGAAPAGSSATNDPLAELARLIGQNDPFAEFGRDAARRAPAAPQQQPAQNWNPQQQAPANYQQQPAADPRTAPPAPAYGAPGYHVSAPTQPRHQQQTFSGPGFDRPVAGAQGHMTGNDPYHGAYDHQAEAQQPHAGDYEADPYYQQQAQAPQQGDDYYDDRPAPRKRLSILAIAGIFMLAVVGVAGAYGYRQLFGYPGMRLPPPVIKADTAPSKVVPAASSDQKSNTKAIYDRVGDRPQTEKIVSREEAPVDIKNRPAAFPPPPAPQAATTGALQVSADPMSTEPKKIHTIVIRPDQAAMPAPAIAAAPPPPSPQPAPARAAANPPPARVASAQPEPVAEPTRATANHRPAPAPVVHRAEPVSSNAPLSLSPDSNAGTLPPPPPRNVSRVASAPRAEAAPPAASRPTKLAPPPVGAAAASGAHGYAVQVSSQRSEADAESSFRALQAKYPQQLGGRQPVIRRADLGAKGVYYRAMVGPFTNGNEATQLCTALKAAGGSCIIQKN